MTTAATFVEGLLEPLDRARTALFVRAARLAPLRPLLVEKRRRVPALLLAHGSVALLLSFVAPTLLLVAGPLLLGVPHLLSDVRYLVLRPALTKGLRALLLGGSAALLLTRLLESLGVGAARFELSLATAWILGVVLLTTPLGRPGRAACAVAALVVLGGAALLWPARARLVLAHGHNLIALGIWALVFCRSRKRALGVAALLLGAAALLLASPLAWWGFVHGWPSCFGLHAFAAADQLAPGVRSAPLALGLVASFAFLQSVHYAVWLHAIPQDATRGEGSPSFRMSYRALAKELGRPALGLVALLVVLVPLAGCWSPLGAQSAYLSLAAFHGYLELAALAAWWTLGLEAASPQAPRLV